MLPQVQILVDDWVEYDPITCIEISSGTWTVNPVPTYGVTATGIVTGYLNNGDCPGMPFQFGAIFYTWTSTDPNAMTDHFAADWMTPDGLYDIHDTVNITLASVTIQSGDLVNNNIAITVNGPTGTTAPLTVNVMGVNNTYTLNYDNGNPVGSGQYSVALTRPDMVKDVYSSIEADWNASTPPVKGTFTITPPWKVRGKVENSVYIKVYESACNGSPTSGYWTFDRNTCVFTAVQLKPTFSSQTNLNGTGLTSGGTLVHTNKQDKLCLSKVPPPGANNTNTYYTISGITGTCLNPLSNGDVAVYPNPHGGSGPYACNDQLLYVDGNNQNAYYPQIVEDSCPACKYARGIGYGDHVDNYMDTGGCFGPSLPDYWEADLGSGGTQVRLSQPITGTAPPKLPSYRDDEITVESRKDDNSIVLSITSDHGQKKDVPLPAGIIQIQEIRRYADRLIVVGDIAAAASQVVIINVNNSTVADSFLDFYPVISPDGRFIAFVKWFLPHFNTGPGVPEDHEMLYDMTKSALGNRPAGVAPDDDINVGFNVYPGNGNKDGDNYVPERLAHTLRGGTFWSPNSTKLVFPDEAQSSLKLVLVTVPGPNTGAAPSTSILPLDNTGLCPATPWPNNYCAADMYQVKFLENGLDTFFSKEGSVHRELQVKYADFVAPR
ncbi:MAG: hypothetical protein WA655_03480 [Candidatus Korobacteraceae bacterium]